MLRKKDHEQRPEWVLALPHLTLDDTPDEDSLYAWNRNGDIFDQMLPKLALTGEEKVLELGASTCWATARFAELGCDCTAIDITRPKYYGLETAEVWMDAKDIYFERVLCDMHNTPFDDATFDLVFACAALHHSSDLKKLFTEIRRIIAPRGRFVAMAEPLAPLFRHKELDVNELKYGINENIYTIVEWRRALKRAGFRVKPFLDSFLDEDKAGLAKVTEEKVYSPNPLKRLVKTAVFSSAIPKRLRVNLAMTVQSISCFNFVAYPG
jgi:ubiquinone/menaquinone biosynthesis C-methylase UbiE